jgi:hypothetical protein
VTKAKRTRRTKRTPRRRLVEFTVTDLAKWEAFCLEIGLEGDRWRTVPIGARVRLVEGKGGGTEVLVKRP